MRISKETWEKWYAALKKEDPEAYQKAIEYAEGVSINHCIKLAAAGEIERTMVMLACDLLRIRP